MNIGMMDTKVIIKSPTYSKGGAGDRSVSGYNDALIVSGSVKWPNGSEGVNQGRDIATWRVEVLTHYNPGVEREYLMEIDGEFYEIISVTKTNFRKGMKIIGERMDMNDND